MKTPGNMLRLSVCPKCGQTYAGHPATSRVDGTTHICPDCGTREALESLGVERSEQDKILESIHRSMGRF